jgi:DNA-binding LytR/AlgR family response regulator
MSAPGWKASYPNPERSRWSGSRRVLFDPIEVREAEPTDLIHQAVKEVKERTTTHADYLTRMSLRAGNNIFLIRVRDVVWIQSRRNMLRVHLHHASYEHRMTMKDILQRLDPERFLRVHRSAIVNLDHVVEFELPRCGNAFVHLSNGLALPVSKAARLVLRRGLL